MKLLKLIDGRWYGSINNVTHSDDDLSVVYKKIWKDDNIDNGGFVTFKSAIKRLGFLLQDKVVEIVNEELECEDPKSVPPFMFTTLKIDDEFIASWIRGNWLDASIQVESMINFYYVLTKHDKDKE